MISLVNPKILLIIGGIILALFALGKYNSYQQRIGFDKAVEAISKENKIAEKAAEKVKRNVDQCYDDGGEWDVKSGSCSKS